MACRIILLVVAMAACVARRVSLDGKIASGQYLAADVAQNHAEDFYHDSHDDGHGHDHDDAFDHGHDGAHDHGHGHDDGHDKKDKGHDDAHGHGHDHDGEGHADGHDGSHDHGHDGSHDHGHDGAHDHGHDHAHDHGHDHGNSNDHDRNHAHGHDDGHSHGHDHDNDHEGHDHGHGHGKLAATFKEVDFDCSAGIDKAQWGWSALKKKKCGWKDPHAGHDHDHDHSDLERPTTTEVHVHKGIAILAIFLSAVAGVLLRLSCPALNSPTVFGFINVFAGGMFVSMGLFHILPETIDHSPRAMQMLIPTGEANNLGIMLFVSLGFLLVLFFERVLFNAHGGSEHEHSGKLEQHDEILKQALNPKNSFIARAVSGESQEELQRASVPASHHTTHEDKDGVAAVLLMLSLSVHSMFEGVIVGTATTKETIWLLTAIVVAHKWAAAFAITNQLTAKQLAGWTAWILLSIFASASPIGAAIGWVIEDAAEANPTAKLIECILNSLAVGTLFYIGMTEVVPEEFTGGRHAFLKFFVFVAAFAFVLFLTILHLTYGHAHHDHAH